MNVTWFYERQLFSTSSTRGLPSTDRKYQPGPRRALWGPDRGAEGIDNPCRNAAQLSASAPPPSRFCDDHENHRRFLSSANNDLEPILFFFSFFGSLIYLLCSSAPIFIERSSIEKVMSFVYELKKSKSNQTHDSIFHGHEFPRRRFKRFYSGITLWSFHLFFFFFYRSLQVSEHRCQMKIDEARTLVQTSSCHESTLWTNVSAYWTYTHSLCLSLSLLLLSSLVISIIRFILHSPHLLSAYIWREIHT